MSRNVVVQVDGCTIPGFFQNLSGRTSNSSSGTLLSAVKDFFLIHLDFLQSLTIRRISPLVPGPTGLPKRQSRHNHRCQ
jgi:hypothetical protein